MDFRLEFFVKLGIKILDANAQLVPLDFVHERKQYL